MKAVHRDEFAPPDEMEVPSIPGIEMVPPGIMKLVDERIDARINAALEAYLPQVQEAVAGAMNRIVTQAQAANPGLSLGAIPPGGGGVIPGSPVTPAGAELIRWMTRGGDDTTGMEQLAKTLTQARAISDVLNPPSIWDRVMQNAVLRSLSKAGLVTDAEVKELIEPAKKS